MVSKLIHIGVYIGIPFLYIADSIPLYGNLSLQFPIRQLMDTWAVLTSDVL